MKLISKLTKLFRETFKKNSIKVENNKMKSLHIVSKDDSVLKLKHKSKRTLSSQLPKNKRQYNIFVKKIINKEIK